VFLIVKEPVARPAVLRGPHVQAFLEHDVSLLFSVVLIPSSLAAVSDFFEAVFSGNGEGRSARSGFFVSSALRREAIAASKCKSTGCAEVRRWRVRK
jgi:hypothetical protein